MSKRFATVFSFIEDYHLIKDPGMIPFMMHREYGYDVTLPISSLYEYPDLDRYFADCDTPIISDAKASARSLNRFKWIFKNARNIDVLNLYFFDRWTFLDLWIYLKRNRNGLVYVHTDSDGERLINNKLLTNPAINFLLHTLFLTSKNLAKVLWGIQNAGAVAILKGTWPFTNIEYIPDGFYWEYEDSVAYKEKSNTILTVARNGHPSKRTDILLEGWASIADEFPSWTLDIVGPVEEVFVKSIEEYFDTHPKMRSRVNFTGPVYDRAELAKIYSRAKVFTLTSDWESFGIVTAEAMSKGCYIVGSDISSTSEITQHGEYGLLFNAGDVNDFANKLRQALSDEERLESNCPKAIEYANNNYSWRNIMAPVDKWIKSNPK